MDPWREFSAAEHWLFLRGPVDGFLAAWPNMAGWRKLGWDDFPLESRCASNIRFQLICNSGAIFLNQEMLVVHSGVTSPKFDMETF